MTQPYFIPNQNAALERRIEALESALWYARDQLLRRMFGTVFEDVVDRIDMVLPDQLTQDIAEWCAVYDKRVVMISVNGNVKADPEFAKEQS